MRRSSSTRTWSAIRLFRLIIIIKHLIVNRYFTYNQVLTLLLRLGYAVIVDGHSQGDYQEEGEESHSVQSVSVHLGDRVLVDLTHLLLDSHLHIKTQTLCKV